MISNVPNTSTFGEPVFVEPGALHAQFAPATGAPRWIAFDAPPAPGHSYVRTLPGEGNGRWQVSVEAGNAVRWRRDGGELFFISNQSFMAVDVEASATFRPSAPRLLFVTPGALRTAMSQYALGYDVAADGRRFITTFPGPETPASVINVIINWQSALLEK
jgi:hypothetical protein